MTLGIVIAIPRFPERLDTREASDTMPVGSATSPQPSKPRAEPQNRSRLDAALRVLGVIALAEVIIMTAALVLGVMVLVFVDNVSASFGEPPRGNLFGDNRAEDPQSWLVYPIPKSQHLTPRSRGG